MKPVGKPSGSIESMPNQMGQMSEVQNVLNNLQNARAVWGAQSRQLKEIQKMAEDLLGQHDHSQELAQVEPHSSVDDLMSKLKDLALDTRTTGSNQS